MNKGSVEGRFKIPDSVLQELRERDLLESGDVADFTRDLHKSTKNLVWDKDRQGVPSAMLRSALFGILKRGERSFIKDVSIASWSGTEVQYTGEQLAQSDQDVWMACVEACKRAQSSQVVISQRELCRLAGKPSNRVWLKATLSRLVANAVKIKTGKVFYVGSLICSASVDENSGAFQISLNADMFVLFGSHVTHLDSVVRKSLRTDMSKWLQGYVCSHKSSWSKPHFIKLDKIQSLCGSSIANEYKFKQQLRRALDAVYEAGVLAGWEINKKTLNVWTVDDKDSSRAKFITSIVEV